MNNKRYIPRKSYCRKIQIEKPLEAKKKTYKHSSTQGQVVIVMIGYTNSCILLH